MKKESQERTEEALFACVVKLHAAMMTVSSEMDTMSAADYSEIMQSMHLVEKDLKHIRSLVYRLAGRDGPEFPGKRSDS